MYLCSKWIKSLRFTIIFSLLLPTTSFASIYQYDAADNQAKQEREDEEHLKSLLETKEEYEKREDLKKNTTVRNKKSPEAIAGFGSVTATGIAVPISLIVSIALAGTAGVGLGLGIGIVSASTFGAPLIVGGITYALVYGYRKMADTNKYKHMIKNNKPIECFKFATDKLNEPTTKNYKDVIEILNQLSTDLYNLPQESNFKAAEWKGGKNNYTYQEVCQLYVVIIANFLATLNNCTYTGEKKAYKLMTPYLNEYQIQEIKKVLSNILNTCDNLQVLSPVQQRDSLKSVQILNKIFQNFKTFIHTFKLNKKNRISSIYKLIDIATEKICSLHTTNFKDLRITLSELADDIEFAQEENDSNPIDQADIALLYIGIATLIQKMEQHTYSMSDYCFQDNSSLTLKTKTLFIPRVTHLQLKQLQKKLYNLIALTLENTKLFPPDTGKEALLFLQQITHSLKMSIANFTSKNEKKQQRTEIQEYPGMTKDPQKLFDEEAYNLL